MLVKINQAGCILYVAHQQSIGYNIHNKRKCALRIFYPPKLFRAKTGDKHFQTCKSSETIATWILLRKTKQNKINLAYQEINLENLKKDTDSKN